MEYLLVQYKRKELYRAPSTLEESVFVERSKKESILALLYSTTIPLHRREIYMTVNKY